MEPMLDPGQAAIALTALVGLALLRLAGWRQRRISALRHEIERRSEMVRSYDKESEAYRLYRDETDGMATEIRRLKAGAGAPTTILAVIVVLSGLGAAGYGAVTNSPLVLLLGGASVIAGFLLLLI
ncbi:hypothetical protein [Streptomyces californicus]|uniref:hypothetical protein n=1 Tax=Streptomyces californicus TaxID=67351 RepID=UPI00296EFC5A|nr:hypothetical protein [Streptomyces californicus]MDW4912536.1 hypothetical protein [Streptomyces californicus]